MNPLHWLACALEARFAKPRLARAVAVLLVALLVSQLVLVWWIGSVGLALRETAYSDDDRTVVIDHADVRTFERDYVPDREVGWCLYGSVNSTHIRIDEVVRADPLSASAERVSFSCIPETVDQATALSNPQLIGTVHSHPGQNRSRPSRFDTMTWGRLSPVVGVMGIYTEADGPEFFTERSLSHPLSKRTRYRAATE
jgi:proteasome lid subunit RPN8/RPN11